MAYWRRTAAVMIAGAVVLLSTVAMGASYSSPLPAPVALTAFSLDNGVELRWQYGRYGQHPVSHFEVYRSTDQGLTFCRQASVVWEPPYDPSWTDQNAPSGWSVYYVRAVSDSGERTERSNTAAAYPLRGGGSVSSCVGRGE